MTMLPIPGGTPETGGIGQMPTPSSFIWGRGGRRMTPEQIELQRKIAAGMMQTDYSPIASPWQGLARVAENITGALQEKRALKAQDANNAAQQQIIAALTGGDGTNRSAAATAAMTSPYVDAGTQSLAKMIWERENPEPSNFLRSWQDYLSLPDDQKQAAWQFREAGVPRIIGSAETGMYELPQAPAPMTGQGLPIVTDQASFDAIPSGQHFRDPEGNIRMKP